MDSIDLNCIARDPRVRPVLRDRGRTTVAYCYYGFFLAFTIVRSSPGPWSRLCVWVRLCSILSIGDETGKRKVLWRRCLMEEVKKNKKITLILPIYYSWCKTEKKQRVNCIAATHQKKRGVVFFRDGPKQPTSGVCFACLNRFRRIN